jgi:hypothetical protein
LSFTCKLSKFWKRTRCSGVFYNFEIKYRPGVNNADADALSRLPALANITDNTSELPLASVQAICNFISVPAVPCLLPVSYQNSGREHGVLES